MARTNWQKRFVDEQQRRADAEAKVNRLRELSDEKEDAIRELRRQLDDCAGKRASDMLELTAAQEMNRRYAERLRQVTNDLCGVEGRLQQAEKFAEHLLNRAIIEASIRSLGGNEPEVSGPPPEVRDLARWVPRD